MRIKLAGIFVNDQDNARTFYSEVLGFQVHTDAARRNVGSPSCHPTTLRARSSH